MPFSKNGIRFLTDKFLSEIRRGCNTCQCPPPKIPTSSHAQVRTGVTVDKLPD